MRKLILWVVAVAAASVAVMTTGGHSQAGVIPPPGLREAADELLLSETVQFTWRPALLLVQRRMAGPRLVPVRLSFAARHGLGRAGRVAQVATARPPLSSSSVEATSAGNPISATTPCYAVMTSLPVAAG
jgi:hypothetical protein